MMSDLVERLGHTVSALRTKRMRDHAARVADACVELSMRADRIEALESALIEAAETTDDPITSRKLFATLNRSIGGSNALVSGPVQSGGQAGSGTNRSHGDDNG